MTSLLQDAAVVPEPGMTLRQLRDLAAKKVRNKEIKSGTCTMKSNGTTVPNSAPSCQSHSKRRLLPEAATLYPGRIRFKRNAYRERRQHKCMRQFTTCNLQPTSEHAQFMFALNAP